MLRYYFPCKIVIFFLGVITDDTRIRGSSPTVEYLVKNGAKVKYFHTSYVSQLK